MKEFINVEKLKEHLIGLKEKPNKAVVLYRDCNWKEIDCIDVQKQKNVLGIVKKENILKVENEPENSVDLLITELTLVLDMFHRMKPKK